MPCYGPLVAYRSKSVNKSGKRSLVFKKSEGLPNSELKIPCGQCIGCRLERSRQWAMRCVHEAQLHADNAFITLTYEDKHLPPGGSLEPEAFQLFMKRLRKAISPERILFFACGEYGSKYGRPHYHACIFGYGFPDRRLWSRRRDIALYRSDLLEKCWQFGLSSVGDVTFESAAYVARYIVKKWLGSDAAEHYQRVDCDTGEITSVEPEFTRMSLRPAVGKKWFEQYTTDVYPSDEVVLRGRKMRPPKYYNGLYELDEPAGMARIKEKRVQAAVEFYSETSSQRLREMEHCKKLQAKRLIRSYEDG